MELRAVSPLFDVSILISDNCKNGEANYSTIAEDGVKSATFTVVRCSCQSGWVGEFLHKKCGGLKLLFINCVLNISALHIFYC